MDEDFVDVKGQDYAKRALLIAAAGCHNVLMIGPPGTGKTLLAKPLPTILPLLTPAESLETTQIYSSMGRLEPGQPLMAGRPFCTPHHSISDAGLVGGGTPPSRATPRLTRVSCSLTRCPIHPQDALGASSASGRGQGTISRAMNSSTFPADFILVAAMNPCPCGYRSRFRKRYAA